MSPEEKEKLELEERLEILEASNVSYAEKVEINQAAQVNYQKLDIESTTIDLVDTSGERKYLTSKQDEMASEYLAERGVYHLCEVVFDEEIDGKNDFSSKKQKFLKISNFQMKN